MPYVVSGSQRRLPWLPWRPWPSSTSRSTRLLRSSWAHCWRAAWLASVILLASLNLRAEYLAGTAFDTHPRSPQRSAQERLDLLTIAALTWPFDYNLRWAPHQFRDVFNAIQEQRTK